jgi:cytochrome c553
MNIAEPEKSEGYFGGGNVLLDLRGRPIRSANLTFDEETGIGKWSEEDFVRTLATGFRPDGTPLRFPMGPIPELDEEELRAVYAYLRSLPKIANRVPRQAEPEEPAVAASEGQKLYTKYACSSCHGDDGMGQADLRQAAQHFQTREALEDWIRHAPSIKPGTRMPAWDGIIAEPEYAPLIDHVLALGGAGDPR